MRYFWNLSQLFCYWPKLLTANFATDYLSLFKIFYGGVVQKKSQCRFFSELSSARQETEHLLENA